MNEKLQYAEMLDIPVSSCNITYKPKRKRRLLKDKNISPKNIETVKQELVDKINEEVLDEQVIDVKEPDIMQEYHQYANEQEAQVVTSTVTKKPKRQFSKLIVAQVALVGALVLTICLTTALIKDSALNVFFRNVFSSSQVETDLRVYTDFKPNAPTTEEDGVTLSNGVMKITKEGSVYSPCDGKITSITADENGTFDIEIAHSDNFRTVFSNVDYVYGKVGDKVYSTIPLGYVDSMEASACFMSNSGLVTGYTILDGNVVWGA